jgi:hypothetical protein
MLLSEARTRLLKLVDDHEGVRFDADGDAVELDAALRTGQAEAWALAVQSNRALFRLTASVSSSSAGLVDLTSLGAMLPLESVAMTQGPWRGKVSPASISEAAPLVEGVHTLSVAYLPLAVFPASAGTAFAWWNAAAVAPHLDMLTLCFAASDLLIKDAAVNQALELRKAELRDTITARLSGSGWSVLPMDELAGVDRRSGLAYVQASATSIQLVHP